ncbi:MAG: fumarylacetoacetate hydrolase family protein, partial [Planctomycetota bacterium]
DSFADRGQFDYEAELVVIIGNTCRYTPIDQAMNYVYGYCCGHDVSARDWQKGRAGGQWLLGKTFDTFGPLGPAAVHHSVVGDVASLRVQMRINGETMQDSTTSQLIFTVPELVSHLSQFCTLHPGDIIFTGTPPGVGAAKQPPRFLRDGDVCEVEIDGLGVLRNPVINAP